MSGKSGPAHKKQVFPPKVIRPSAGGALKRERLFEQINKARAKPVIWITGPAGSGKTTLASSYIEAQKLPCLWYQVDGGDVELPNFFYYMGLAARKANPRKRKPMPLLTPEYMLGIPTFTRRYFEELYSRMKVPSLLVIDDYQEAAAPHSSPPGAGFHECIATAVSGVPEGITVVVLSRTPPPEEFARLRAQGRLVQLGWEDLKFSREETGFLTEAKGRADLHAEDLYRNTDGWAAGLVLMLSSEETGLHRTARDNIYDFFSSEILQKTDDTTRDFLIKTAVLPEITEDSAQKLTGITGSKEVLNRLSRNNYFTLKKAGVSNTFEYHALFREFLIEKLYGTFTEDEVHTLRRQAAGLLMEQDSPEDAAGLLVEAKAWEDLSRLIMVHAQELMLQGRHQVIERWLRSMPGEIMNGNPWLIFWFGASMLSITPYESFEHFQKAFGEFNAMNDPAGTFLSYAFILDAIYFMQEDFSEFDRWIPRIEEIEQKYHGLPPGEIGARVASNVLRTLVLWQPEHQDMQTWRERALSLAETSVDVTLRVNTLSFNALLLQLRGDIPGASEATRALRRLVTRNNTGPLASLLALVTEVMYNTFLRGDQKTSLDLIEKALELEKESGVYVLNGLLVGNTAWNCISAHDFASSRRFIEMLEASSIHLRKWDMIFYLNLVSYEALEKGDLINAGRHIDRAFNMSDAFIKTTSMPHIYMTKAQVLHELGHTAEAGELVEKARQHGRVYQSPYHEWSCLVAEAQFALDAGNRETCIGKLRPALEIARQGGYVNTLLWRPKVMSRLFAVALEEGIEPEHVRYIIKQRRLEPDDRALLSERWPHRLKVYTMGQFRILLDGKPLRHGAKTGSKPMELLIVTIALGGEDISSEKVIDTLWDEADGDAAYSAFTTNLSRLRKIIGPEVLMVRDGRITLDRRFCWVDSLVFESMLERAPVSLSDDYAGRVLGLYAGEFMKGRNDHWSHSVRERLRSRFLGFVSSRAEELSGRNEHEAALNLYNRGLETDPLAEEMYRGLMRCYLKLGRRSEGFRVYQKCQDAILQAFGVEPSSETKELYNSLKV